MGLLGDRVPVVQEQWVQIRPHRPPNHLSPSPPVTRPPLRPSLGPPFFFFCAYYAARAGRPVAGRAQGRGSASHRPPPSAVSPDEVHLPGIYVHRLILGKDYEKRIEKRTTSAGTDAAASIAGAAHRPHASHGAQL